MSNELEKNKGGRPPGAVNKVSKEAKAILANKVGGLITYIDQWIIEIEDPKDRIDAIAKILPYFMSKASENELADLKNRIIINYINPKEDVEEADVVE